MATIVTKWERGTFANHKLREALNNAEGEWLEVTIRKARYKPSPRSHRYYRGYLLPVLTQAMNDAGCEHNGRPLNIEWVHRMLKALFALQVTQQGDDFAYAVPSCSELDAEQMKQYIMRVERYAIEEWGIQAMDIE
jgi:hypothetical protein